MTLWDKVKIKTVLIFNSFFYAMRGGDRTIFQTSNGKSDSEINHQVSPGGVMQDLLNQEETDQVKEIRDEYYRILNEADKYHVDIKLILNEEGELASDISADARKKTSSDYSKHCNVYETQDTKLRLIQDNKHIEKDSTTAMSTFSNKDGVSVWDYETILDIDWGDIIPRFRLNKFVSKIVVRTVNNTEAIVDLYLPTISGQFTKLDAIIISELNRLFKDKECKSDLKNIVAFRFITDKAWNCDSLCMFKYDLVKFDDIIVFDGNFILSYKCRVLIDGKSITEKYKTKELDEKYANNATKKDAVDVFTLDRHINGVNFGSTTLKINNKNE